MWYILFNEIKLKVNTSGKLYQDVANDDLCYVRIKYIHIKIWVVLIISGRKILHTLCSFMNQSFDWFLEISSTQLATASLWIVNTFLQKIGYHLPSNRTKILSMAHHLPSNKTKTLSGVHHLLSYKTKILSMVHHLLPNKTKILSVVHHPYSNKTKILSMAHHLYPLIRLKNTVYGASTNP